MSVNKDGFLVHWRPGGSQYKTYACEDRKALRSLIEYLTGREATSFPKGAEGLPTVPYLVINSNFHIWGSD